MGLVTTKEFLIRSGIKNLKEFGYADVNEDNIMTDKIYKAFFQMMLIDSLGEHPDVPDVNIEIHKLLKIIDGE